MKKLIIGIIQTIERKKKDEKRHPFLLQSGDGSKLFPYFYKTSDITGNF